MNELSVLVERFGPALCSYAGQGRLHVANGDTLDVKFTAAQLLDGSNVLFCIGVWGEHAAETHMLLVDGVERFEGQTVGGLHVATAGRIWSQDFPGDMPRELDFDFLYGYSAQILRVSARGGTPDTVRYGLTNVRPFPHAKLSLHLTSDTTTARAELLRVPDCQPIFDRIRVLRDSAVTCELKVLALENLTEQQMDQVATDVSYLLSVAQGCKVAWIYREKYDSDGLFCREHRMAKTAPFTPFELVPTRPYAGFQEFTGVKEFVEMTYPTYVRRRDSWGLTLGPIDLYLEAKAEADYLETRGAKLAVALESLKHRYLRSGEASTTEFVIESFDEFLSKLVSATSEVLPDQYARVVNQNALRAKLRGLNRRSFSQIIKHLALDIDLQLHSKERGTFVTSRDFLVHQGQFHCKAVQAGEAKRTRTLKDSPVEEYFFMMDILDRIILALLGYSGPYVDRREQGSHRIASLP